MAYRPDTYFLASDLDGKLAAKLIPGSAVDQHLDSGVRFSGAALGSLGRSPGESDLVAVPDRASYFELPWLPGSAAVFCDLYTSDGMPWSLCGRGMLRRVAERCADRYGKPQIGAEVEYTLLEGRDNRQSYGTTTGTAGSCYDARLLVRNSEFVASVVRNLEALGWDPYAADHEDGPGQFEQNFSYSDALTTADRVMTFRWLIYHLADSVGRTATFMPKPIDRATANGLHFHFSLSRLESGSTSSNCFVSETDPRSLGLSPIAYQFIAGILAHAPGLSAICAPTPNSYKRLRRQVAGLMPISSPGYISYGADNRSHLVRVPAPGRFEYRGPDSSANPYLAIGAALHAGMHGAELEGDPGDPNPLDLYELDHEAIIASGAAQLPPTLLHAVDALRQDGILTHLGQGGVATSGPNLTTHYASTRELAHYALHDVVGPEELAYYKGGHP